MIDFIFHCLGMLSDNYTMLEAVFWFPFSCFLILFLSMIVFRGNLVCLIIVFTTFMFNLIAWDMLSKENSVVYNKNIITRENFDSVIEPNSRITLEKIKQNENGHITTIQLDLSKNVIYELDVVKQKWGVILAKMKYVSLWDDGQLVDHTEYFMTHNGQFDGITHQMSTHIDTLVNVPEDKTDENNVPLKQIEQDNKALDDMINSVKSHQN